MSFDLLNTRNQLKKLFNADTWIASILWRRHKIWNFRQCFLWLTYFLFNVSLKKKRSTLKDTFRTLRTTLKCAQVFITITFSARTTHLKISCLSHQEMEYFVTNEWSFILFYYTCNVQHSTEMNIWIYRYIKILTKVTLEAVINYHSNGEYLLSSFSLCKFF